MCVEKSRKRVISKIYQILIDLKGSEIPPYIEKCEKELGTQVKDVEIRQLLRRVHSTSINSNMLELNYKCLARWYMTPDKAYKFQTEITQYCWQGCKEIGTMAHIWWLCPKIKIYCEKIRQIIIEITNIDKNHQQTMKNILLFLKN